MGGIANPNAALQQMAGTGQQNALNLGTQLGGMAAQQELGAQVDAGQLQSGLLNNSLSSFGQMAGQQGSLLGGGMSELANMGNLFSQSSQAQGNPWGSALGGLGGILGGLPSGSFGGSKSPMTSQSMGSDVYSGFGSQPWDMSGWSSPYSQLGSGQF